MKAPYITNFDCPFSPMKNPNWMTEVAKPHGHVPVPESEINPELLDWFEDRGFWIKNADIFCSPPDFTLGIHVDGTRMDNRIATNWAYEDNEDRGVMHWWKPKPGFENPSDLKPEEHGAYSISTTPYALAWVDSQCDLMYSSVVGNPSLVNIGIPHSMSNGSVQRFAVSITWVNYKNEDMEWDQAYERLVVKSKS